MKAEKVVLEEHCLNYFCSQRAGMWSVNKASKSVICTAPVLLMLDFAGLTI